MRILRFSRRVLLLGVILAICAAAALAFANWWVLRASEGHIVERVKDLRPHDVGLVLGTSPTLRSGSDNPFFVARMDAAAKLFREGKVRHLLVSGDNGQKDYDEPSAMRDALVARGVPADAVTLDYAGFRTLDSVERARIVFGLKEAVIITDDFHLPRSLFLAKAKGLKAVGFRPKPVPWRWSKKTRTREIASRVAAVLDIYLLHTKPRFSGPREEIRLAKRGE